jgi:hypothetical protein
MLYYLVVIANGEDERGDPMPALYHKTQMPCNEVAFVRQYLDKASIIVSNFNFLKAIHRGDSK